AFEVILRSSQLRLREHFFLDPLQLNDNDVDELANRAVRATGINRQGTGVAIRAEATEYRIGKTALLTNILKKAGAHRSAKHGVEHIARIAVRMILLIAARSEADVTLFQLFVADDDARLDPWPGLR